MWRENQRAPEVGFGDKYALLLQNTTYTQSLELEVHISFKNILKLK